MYDISLGAFDLGLLRLRRKKNVVKRSEMKTSPPITPPMIASVDEEDDELPEGALIEVPDEIPVENEGVIEEVEDGASS